MDDIKKFEQTLKNNHINLEAFIELLNVWNQMSVSERGEIIENNSLKKIVDEFNSFN